MLDEAGVQTLFREIHELWVEPELMKRRAVKTLTREFRIRQCLIKLPPHAPPIVEFNEEITWLVTAKKPLGLEFEKGQPVHISDIESIESVAPPEVDGKRVAFFFVHWTGTGWRIVFDCTPTTSSASSDSTGDDWPYGRSIADYLNDVLGERVIQHYGAILDDIEPISLWPAPALIPYPLSAICDLCKKGSQDEARQLLVKHCSPVFLIQLVRTWNDVLAFKERTSLFSEALQAHENKQYSLSVSALIPHFEGVMTDWMHTKIPDVPFRQESKTKRFRDLIAQGAARSYTNQQVADSVVSFIVDGPVLKTFDDWLAPVQTSFPNRNVVGHGKFDSGLFTEENSIKVFLMLDTLYQIISAHDRPR